MTTEEKLRSSLEKMQRQRATVLAEVSGLSQNQLDFKPAPSSWSVGEVAHHLGLVERGVMGIVKELLKTPKTGGMAAKTVAFDQLPLTPQMIPRPIMQLSPLLAPISVMMRFMPSSIQSFMISNAVLKVRTVPDAEPKPGMQKEEIVAFLHEVRDSTVKLLEPVKDWDLSQFQWQHSLLGRYDVYRTLEFLANHDHRHLQQIETVKKNAGFPRPKHTSASNRGHSAIPGKGEMKN